MTQRSCVLLGSLALTLVVSVGYSASSDASTATATAQASTTVAPSVAFDMQAKTVAVAAGKGNAAHGKTIYAASCASCHGATGKEGGVGPSLKGEKSKKNQAAVVAWIKKPAAPMPKLFPSPLSEKDVSDVAAYVETL